MLAYVGLATLLLTIAGIGVKIIWFMAEIKLELEAIRAERGMVKSIPHIAWRVGAIEHRLDIEPPAMPNFSNGDAS